MALQVRALYDFEGEPSNGELSIREGDIITVTRQDVGEGWWEGYTGNSHNGLFPESYVEVLGNDFPPAPPTVVVNDAQYDSRPDSYASEGGSMYSPPVFTDQTDSRLETSYDEWDRRSSNSDNVSGDYNFGGGGNQRTMSRAATVKRSYNRFSNFVKTGGEDFLLGSKADSAILQKDQIVVVDGLDGAMWQPNPVPFTCAVTEPEKKSKFKGMKSYIAYNVVPTHTGQAVQHRFKHFDWLYERLIEKYPCISVPPLPDKQVTGRYSEDLIKRRRQLLEKWMNRVARHPVLAQSSVFQHFVTVCSETKEKEWKDGKRKAETDKMTGVQFFYTLTTPSVTMSLPKVENEVDHFKDFVRVMDDSSKQMIVIGENHWDKVSRSYKAEYKKLGAGFESLASSFSTDNGPSSLALTQAIQDTGKTYDEIGDLCQDQPRNDIQNVLEVLREYTSILSTYPEIVDVHKGAMKKVKECQKMQEDDELQYSEMADINTRMDRVTNGMFAEIHHFQRERVQDFKDVMKLFLTEQIQFHQEIINKLNRSLHSYDNVPE